MGVFATLEMSLNVQSSLPGALDRIKKAHAHSCMHHIDGLPTLGHSAPVIECKHRVFVHSLGQGPARVSSISTWKEL